jgi:predicted protein tyrosine phosphatase
MLARGDRGVRVLLGYCDVMKRKKVLTVCTGNKDRSPTAAMLLAEMCAPMWVTSAGTEPWARNPLTHELVEEADVILVMEDAHRRHIVESFGVTHGEKVVVLDVPDNYYCWEDELIHVLKPRIRTALGLRTVPDHERHARTRESRK